MSKGKILQVVALGITADQLLKPLIRDSIKEGYEVHLACSYDDSLRELLNLGVILHEVNIDRKIDLESNYNSVKKLYTIMKNEKFDIVHVHTPVAAVLGRVASKLARVPKVIYTAHGFYFHEDMNKIEYSTYYSIEKTFAKYATDYLLLQSEEDYILSINKNFQRYNNIIHLGNGVDIDNKFNLEKINTTKVRKIKDKYKLNNKTVFVFIGRLVKEKGIYELISSFEELNEKYPDTRLLIIGDLLESERDQSLKKKLPVWKENKDILFLGYRNDTPELLAASDVFILPSYREGLPRSIIEAMALKLPIIATNIRGSREEIKHGQNGFLIEKKETRGLLDKMEYLTLNKKERIKMGEAGRRIVEEKYDEKKVIEKQLKLFNKLTNKNNI